MGPRALVTATPVAGEATASIAIAWVAMAPGVPAHAPMTQFPVRSGEIVVGGKRISEIAAEVGRTPFYVYDRRVIDARIAGLRAALPREIGLHYAIKANPMPALVGHVARIVDGLDVASAGELRVALSAGMAGERISFAGPGKRDEELAAALAAGILINIESFREIRILARLASEHTTRARIAVRVNPDFELKASGMKMGGGPKQFGIDADQVPAAIEAIAAAGLAFEGLHIYSGSQNLHADAICEAQRKAYELALGLSATSAGALRSLNLGGGFGIPYFPGESPLDLRPIGENLHALAVRASTELPGCALCLELGRYLVGEAGLYVCRVIDRKISRGQVFLVTDGGLHHHLAASGNFGQVIRKNYPLAIANRMGSIETEVVNVVGPLCTPLDLLAERMTLPVAREGDLVAVYQSGAYGYTASPLAFLGHPPPVEALI